MKDKSNNLLEQLLSLSPNQMAAVERLVGKFSKKDSEEDLIVEHGPGRDKPRQRIVLKESDKTPDKRSKGRGRTQPRNNQNEESTNKIRKRVGKGKGAMARTEQVVLKNENRFLKMREKDSEKKDVEIDKKLWSGRSPSERPEEFQYAEVQCKVCNKYFDINPALVVIDRETHQPNFTCNDCAASNRGR